MNIELELITRAQKKEGLAITELFQKLFPILTQTDITSFLRGTGENIDIALITLQKVFAHLENQNFENPEKFASWVFTIHRRTTIDWIRKSERRAHLRYRESQYLEPTIPPKDYEKRDLFRLVYDFIHKHQDPKTGHILLLSSAGYSDEKIAKRLKKPVGTIKARLRRARIKIREYLESLESTTESP